MGIKELVNAEGYYTIADVAKMIGRHPDTVNHWIKNGTFQVRYEYQAGKIMVNCFDEEDIEKLREIAKNKRPGRPRKTKPQDRPPLALVAGWG